MMSDVITLSKKYCILEANSPESLADEVTSYLQKDEWFLVGGPYGIVFSDDTEVHCQAMMRVSKNKKKYTKNVRKLNFIDNKKPA